MGSIEAKATSCVISTAGFLRDAIALEKQKGLQTFHGMFEGQKESLYTELRRIPTLNRLV
jgi:hypothetical protein